MIGFPISEPELHRMREGTKNGQRLSRTDTQSILDAYEALVIRLSAVDAAVRGLTDDTYFGADVRAAKTERERLAR